MRLDAALASRMASIALGHVAREYPHKLDHVLASDEGLAPPRVQQMLSIDHLGKNVDG